MAIEPGARTDRRAPLTKERVLRAAVDLADRDGIDGLSMRKLGQELGVDAMALYRHVRNKDDILDGILDAIVGEIDVTSRHDDWKTAMAHQVLAARQVMLRHPWAPRVLEERSLAGPATLAYIESILGIFLDGGFSLEMAHHALHAMGSRILGFNQDLFDDSNDESADPEAAALAARAMAPLYPRIAELAIAARHDGVLGRCDDDFEYAFGLDLILDGLERRRVAADPGGGAPGA